MYSQCGMYSHSGMYNHTVVTNHHWFPNPSNGSEAVSILQARWKEVSDLVGLFLIKIKSF